jgi:hypothetical protein
VWSVLADMIRLDGVQCLTPTLNPKVVTCDELYGFMPPPPRSWQDGLLSSILRDIARYPGEDPKVRSRHTILRSRLCSFHV